MFLLSLLISQTRMSLSSIWSGSPLTTTLFESGSCGTSYMSSMHRPYGNTAKTNRSLLDLLQNELRRLALERIFTAGMRSPNRRDVGILFARNDENSR